jgi:uncharacterized protein
MHSFSDTLLITLLGAVIGTVLALTGAGGGVLSVPLLVLFLRLPVQVAAPVSLLAVGLASALGAAMGLREGIVRYRAAMLIGFVGMVAAPLGLHAAHHLPQRTLVAGFGALMLFLAWRQWRPHTAKAGTQVPQCQVDPSDGRFIWTSPCARALAATGAVSGFLSGLIGVGGGFIIVPSLNKHSTLTLPSAQATSLAVIALVSAGSTVSAVWNGQLSWTVATPFAAGALLALWVGRMLAKRMSRKRLQQIFAWVCAATGLLMLAKGLGHWM